MKIVLKRKTKSFSFSALAAKPKQPALAATGAVAGTVSAIGKFTPASTTIKGVKIGEKRVGSALQDYAAKRG